MKKAIYTFFLLFSLGIVNAQTIHWLTFIDTSDINNGEMCKNEQALLWNRVRNVANAALSTAGYKTNNQEFFGARLNPQNCVKAVQSLQCSPEDIVVFYYIGHGTHAKQEKNPYPQMLLGKGWEDEREFVPLKWVYDELNKKGARLCITIGECCNPIQIATPKDQPIFANSNFVLNNGNTYISEAAIDRILTLFLEYRGSLIQATSSVTESAWGYSFKDMGWMNTFTRFFILQFEDLMEGKCTPSWDTILSKAGQYTSEFQKYMYENNPESYKSHLGPKDSPYQTPFHDISLSKCKRPTGKETITEPEEEEDIAIDEFIDRCLAYLVNKDVRMGQKMAVANKLKGFFTPSAKVKILSQDGETTVSQDSPDTYLDRVATSHVLIDVMLEDIEVNNSGKITNMWVKEYYKK